MKLFKFKRRISLGQFLRDGADGSIRFGGGNGYWATNGANGNQVVVIASERKGGVVTFVKASAIFNVRVGEFDGRETARIIMDDGIYHLSAAAVAPIQESSRVVDAILNR